MGWMPSPSGELRTHLPPLPTDYLQERHVLRDFIFRVNTIGWISRQQFEETWMNLLSVLSPVAPDSGHQQTNVEDDIDRTQCMVLASRGITSLLVQSLLTPVSGDPSTSALEFVVRDKPLIFLQTR